MRRTRTVSARRPVENLVVLAREKRTLSLWATGGACDPASGHSISPFRDLLASTARPTHDAPDHPAGVGRFKRF